MSKYAHSKQKRTWIPKWFIKAFENSEAFHPLKTISRLTGLMFLLFAFLVIKDPFITLIAFPTGILLMDAIFFIFKMKESTYKSQVFFRIAKTTPKSMDKYNLWMFLIRSISFAIFIPFGQIYGYGAICFLFPLLVAPITRFGRFELASSPKNNIPEANLNQASIDDHIRTSPGNLASPLYGLAGIFPTR
ncbi:MAG: hypothetical protein GW748_05185 [Alphaproteobacteria bacterium]|nr:hypothetical protein [Alphaproteobacteria bacterium]NCQ67120.1 hypothetical protein [Alphaproteobacteria bacterium]NCT07717.1 hypothetical protein [Alphaproteobacteria bacterium]